MNSRHVTAHFAGFYLGWMGVDPAPSVDLIRKWAQRGHVTRVGTDPSGFALYSLDHVVEYARHRGMLQGLDEIGD